MDNRWQFGSSTLLASAFEKIQQKVVNDSATPEQVLNYLLSDYISTMEWLDSHLSKEEQNDLALARQLLALLDPAADLSRLRLKPGCENPATLFSSRNNNVSPIKYFMLHLQHRSHLLRQEGWLTALFKAFFSIYEDYRNLMNDRLLSLLPAIPFWQHFVEPACFELSQGIMRRNNTRPEDSAYLRNKLILLKDRLPRYFRSVIAEQVAND